MASPPPIYTMPLEIWLSVLSHLSEPDFLSLKRSSPRLRSIINDNAATICNTLITKNYAQEAAILGTVFRDGWLVPTIPAIVREERELARYASRYASRSNSLVRSFHSSRDTSPAPSQTQMQMQMQIQNSVHGVDSGDSVAPLVCTKLSEPGPQYLRYLIEYSFEIRVANSMFIDVPAREQVVVEGVPPFWGGVPTESKKETPQQKLDRWIGLYTVKRYLGRLHKIAAEADSSPFSSFGSDNSRTAAGDQSLLFVKNTREGLAWFYE